MEETKKRIHTGIEMVLEKVEKISREKKEWSIDEVFKVSDIVKDMAEALKDLSKASEYSIETF